MIRPVLLGEGVMNKLAFYVAGAGGGAITSVIELCKDTNNATVVRLGGVLGKFFLTGGNVYLSPTSWAIIMIILVSVFMCWIYQVTSPIDGFTRGCAVLAAFSIAAPNPPLQNQVTPAANPNISSLYGPSHVAEFPTFVSSALAQSSAQNTAPMGEAYIRLTHLQAVTPMPESTVTIRDDSSQRIAIFKITDNTIRITQPYGDYLISVQTPGYSDIDFELRIDQSVSANKVSAPQSSVPLVIQKLVTATRVALVADDAERYKQLGRQQRFAGNWGAAIADYQKSLQLDPNDVLTHDYLGYVLYREGKYDEAINEFNYVVEHKPDYVWSPINLIKVDCAQQKFDTARQQLDKLKIRTDAWKSDSELSRVCQQIMS